MLMQELTKNSITFPAATLDYIVANLRGEYASIVSEIEKISLYALTTRDVCLEEISQIISNPSEKNSYDPLIKSIINSDFITADKELEKLTLSGLHIVAIARNIANHFVKLLKVKTLMNQGVSEQLAFASLRPPIFFKNVPNFQKGLKNYSVTQLVHIIATFTTLEMECKSTNIKPMLLWEKHYNKVFLSKSLS